MASSAKTGEVSVEDLQRKLAKSEASRAKMKQNLLLAKEAMLNNKALLEKHADLESEHTLLQKSAVQVAEELEQEKHEAEAKAEHEAELRTEAELKAQTATEAMQDCRASVEAMRAELASLRPAIAAMQEARAAPAEPSEAPSESPAQQPSAVPWEQIQKLVDQQARQAVQAALSQQSAAHKRLLAELDGLRERNRCLEDRLGAIEGRREAMGEAEVLRAVEAAVAEEVGRVGASKQQQGDDAQLQAVKATVGDLQEHMSALATSHAEILASRLSETERADQAQLLAARIDQQASELSQVKKREAGLQQAMALFRMTLRPFATAIGSLANLDDNAMDAMPPDDLLFQSESLQVAAAAEKVCASSSPDGPRAPVLDGAKTAAVAVLQPRASQSTSTNFNLNTACGAPGPSGARASTSPRVVSSPPPVTTGGIAAMEAGPLVSCHEEVCRTDSEVDEGAVPVKRRKLSSPAVQVAAQPAADRRPPEATGPPGKPLRPSAVQPGVRPRRGLAARAAAMRPSADEVPGGVRAVGQSKYRRKIRADGKQLRAAALKCNREWAGEAGPGDQAQPEDPTRSPERQNPPSSGDLKCSIGPGAAAAPVAAAGLCLSAALGSGQTPAGGSGPLEPPGSVPSAECQAEDTEDVPASSPDTSDDEAGALLEHLLDEAEALLSEHKSVDEAGAHLGRRLVSECLSGPDVWRGREEAAVTSLVNALLRCALPMWEATGGDDDSDGMPCLQGWCQPGKRGAFLTVLAAAVEAEEATCSALAERLGERLAAELVGGSGLQMLRGTQAAGAATAAAVLAKLRGDDQAVRCLLLEAMLCGPGAGNGSVLPVVAAAASVWPEALVAGDSGPGRLSGRAFHAILQALCCEASTSLGVPVFSHEAQLVAKAAAGTISRHCGPTWGWSATSSLAVTDQIETVLHGILRVAESPDQTSLADAAHAVSLCGVYLGVPWTYETLLAELWRVTAEEKGTTQNSAAVLLGAAGQSLVVSAHLAARDSDSPSMAMGSVPATLKLALAVCSSLVGMVELNSEGTSEFWGLTEAAVGLASSIATISSADAMADARVPDAAGAAAVGLLGRIEECLAISASPSRRLPRSLRHACEKAGMMLLAC